MLASADVHVAVRLAALAPEPDERVILAAALAVRAPRLGHVFVDIARIRETAAVESDEAVDLTTLPWPEVEGWSLSLEASPLVAVGEEFAESRPLRLVGAAAVPRPLLGARSANSPRTCCAFGGPVAVDEGLLDDGLDRLFGAEDGQQRAAAAAAVRRRFAVVAGGPGTGKTTTVARIVALLAEQAAAAGDPAPLVALAAPTGKAQARLQEAVHAAAPTLAVSAAIRAELLALEVSTVHRRLGYRPDGTFRHDARNPLVHDVVIVDETSMVSLPLMARLLDAIRPDARLVLVGDPGQLASVEAGSVLGDIVRAGGGTGVVVLEHVYRYGAGIDALADAIRAGDGDAVIAALTAGHDDVAWIDVDVGNPAAQEALAPVREGAVETLPGGRSRRRGAGDGRGAIDALGRFRVLCAHRRGSFGVSVWTARIEGWLAGELERSRWYTGRPLRDRERLRVAALQRRHRRRGRDGGRPSDRGVRAPRRGGRVRPARLGAIDPRLRDDRPQGAGLAVRHGGGPAALRRVTGVDARAAVHGRHARAVAAHPRGHRGDDPRRGGPAGRARLWPRRTPALSRDLGPRHPEARPSS